MKTQKRKRKNISNLMKASVKPIGFFEKIGLKISGFIDGRNGLPRNDLNGWSSPRIESEIRSFDEFASKIFGALQIENEEKFQRLGQLTDCIKHTEMLLNDAKSLLANAEANEASYTCVRKVGEERMSDEQIANRRKNERAKRLAPAKNRVSSLQNKLNTEIDEFSQLRRTIAEDENTARMICNRVRDHVYQRITIYWRAAWAQHSEKAKMPILPSIILDTRSEAYYRSPHDDIMRRADSLSEEISIKINEEECENV